MIANLVNFFATASDVSNSDLAKLMAKVEEIGDLILTIIYIVLGVFLVIKGALLGMQIVKAADEPQVRQEKIGSLKWLVIGIAIAYGVAFAADILLGVFAKELGAEEAAS